jgi:hypothetical protein
VIRSILQENPNAPPRTVAETLPISLDTAWDEDALEVGNSTFASRKVCCSFDRVPTASMFLRCFLPELHSMRHGSSMETWLPRLRNSSRSKLGMDIKNAPAHNSRMTQNFSGYNPLKALSHSPYSLDISPFDFYLFGKVNCALIGQEIPDEIDLLEAVTEISMAFQMPNSNASF